MMYEIGSLIGVAIVVWIIIRSAREAATAYQTIAELRAQVADLKEQLVYAKKG
jgi:hypothetical protein